METKKNETEETSLLMISVLCSLFSTKGTKVDMIVYRYLYKQNNNKICIFFDKTRIKKVSDLVPI